MPSDLAKKWETAKTEFTRITGKSKPKPQGLIAKAFNHSGLSGDLAKCDKLIDAAEGESRNLVKKATLIEAGRKFIPTIEKSASAYMKTLETAAKDEIADNAEKTTYAKGLKYLRTQLDALEKAYEAKINAFIVANDQTTSVSEKAAKMVLKSLTSTIANAAAGAKKIKADPTPATFDEIFKTSDNAARKVQVQLIAADSAQKKKFLPEAASRRVDPRTVADMFTPWQAGGKGEAFAKPGWGKTEVLAALTDFSKMLKLAGAFRDDLEEALK